MSSSAALRIRLESALAHRIPSALTPQPRMVRPVLATGVSAIDNLLGGGLPAGAISEVVGSECSGRTSLALSFVAELIAEGKVCAWVDVSDTLSPASADAAGIDLSRLLWVRCGENYPSPQAATISPLTIAVRAGSCLPTRSTQGGGSPHPRGEVRGLDTAVQDLMRRKDSFVRDKSLGTPGFRNLPLLEAGVAKITDKKTPRVEQIASDRLPSRRGDYVLKPTRAYAAAAEQQKAKQQASLSATASIPSIDERTFQQKPWSRLDQALRATDLLLQAGGFAAIVLDLGSVAREHVQRVPIATWFRYRAAADKTQASLVLLTQDECAKSSAGILLRMQAEGETGGVPGVFKGLACTAKLGRQRFGTSPPGNIVSMRKPVQNERGTAWNSATAWTARGGQ